MPRERSFVRCPLCKRASAVTEYLCAACGTVLGTSGKTSGVKKGPIIGIAIVALLGVSGYVLTSWYTSYGQGSPSKLVQDHYSIGKEDLNDEILPANAWYKSTFKSWLRARPSLEDVLAQEVRMSGGWAARKALETFEIRGEMYGYGCAAVDQYLMTGDLLKGYDPTAWTMKFKVPKRFARKTEHRFDASVQIHDLRYDGVKLSNCYRSNTPNSQTVCEDKQPERNDLINADFFTAATDWAEDYRDFSDIRLELHGKTPVYSTSANPKKQLIPGSVLSRPRLLFDAVTGRLRAIQHSTDLEIGFYDYKQVGNVSLPHKFCLVGPMPHTFLVTEWKLGQAIEDSEFARPTN